MKKICVMHRASIGDTLLATPVYRAIKECYPASKTIVVTSPIGYELLSGNPDIDILISYEKGDSIFHLIKMIWRSDLAIILDHHYRNALYAFLSGITRRVGRGKNFINIPVKDASEIIFEPLKYLNITKHVGINTSSLQLFRPIPSAKEKKYIKNFCDVIKERNQKMTVIAPFSLAKIKDWEPQKYRQIIKKLHDNDHIVVIIGGKKDFDKIEKEFPTAINFAGKANLRESAELIANADLQICGCTAMLHICSTTNTPSIAIYGPTTPKQWAPRNNCTIVTCNMECSPCYNTGKKFCENNRCIKDISVDEVWAVISKGGYL